MATALAKFVLVTALAIWLGETVFLSLVVAPTLFRGMASPAEAGNVMSLLFPKYYGIGSVCGLVVAACALILWRRTPPPNRAWLVTAGTAGFALLACLYAGVVLQPRSHALRDTVRSDPTAREAKVEFDRLHRRAVQLNGGVLLLTLVAAGAVAQRLR